MSYTKISDKTKCLPPFDVPLLVVIKTDDIIEYAVGCYNFHGWMLPVIYDEKDEVVAWKEIENYTN